MRGTRLLMLVLTAVGLSACAPRQVINTGVSYLTGDRSAHLYAGEYDPETKAVLPTDGAASFLNDDDQAATGNPQTPGDPVALLVVGTPDLVPNDAAAKLCAPSFEDRNADGLRGLDEPVRPGWWRCSVPEVPPRSYFVVGFKSGTVTSGSVTFYRARNGLRPSLVLLEPAPE